MAACAAPIAWADGPQSSPSIFAPASTPASSIQNLSWFVLAITGGIFVTVGGLLAWAIFRYRARKTDDDSEPAQIYGSTQVELAWTVIPVLIVVVLFLTTARIIFAIQDAPKPTVALDVTVVGHQFWWEFRYPEARHRHGQRAARSGEQRRWRPKPTYLQLLSADVDHSFWVPQLGGKTDLIPNHPNDMWMDPAEAPAYTSGSARSSAAWSTPRCCCAYTWIRREQFDAWVKTATAARRRRMHSAAAGRRMFETEACVNCHTIAGTAAKGTFGPDLTHLMSRATIAAGAADEHAGESARVDSGSRHV